ncbi:protein-histidine kinase [Ceratobasidium sp. AG-Ba]|nr:protein-histidine kinase [Ceratobasidium sp. AG-Ba]
MPPGTPTPRAHVRTAPGRISRPSTAPTPTADTGPQLLASSPATSRNPSPAPSPAISSASPALAPSAPPGGPGSAPATAGAHPAAPNGALDWHVFLHAYANGEWDPNRIPDPPMLLAPPLPRVHHRTPSPSVPVSALSSSSTVAVSFSSDAPGTDNSPSSSLGGLAGPDRPRISPESRTTSIASRRGTATPDLSGSSATFKNNLTPYVHAPRKVQRSQSDVEVRSPGGVPTASTPALPSPSIDRAATAATIRWAGSGVDVAPYALPSPEAAELLDPMRNAQPVLHMSSNASSKSSSAISKRLPAQTCIYFRTHSQLAVHSPPSPDLQPEPAPISQTPNREISTSSGKNHQSGSAHANLADACSLDPFSGTIVAVAESPTKHDINPQAIPGVDTGNGYPTVPDHLLTSLSSSGDAAEFFTPSETLALKIDDELDKPTYLVPPFPPDETERRKALYRFNILHTSRDVNFDRITHLCKLVFSTKMVIISLIDADQQWFKSEHGMGTDSTDRKQLLQGSLTSPQRGAEPLIVLDTCLDWRFANNPLVTGPPHIRFYAGAPLRTSDGYNVGSLCVIDDRPRDEFTPRQRHTLKEFAAIVMREMELWRDKIQLQVRDRIQTSMEKFTRECLELEEESGPHGVSSMERVYDRASKLVKRALDVEGAMVLDIANLECVEVLGEDGAKSYSYRGDTFTDPVQIPPTIAASPSVHSGADKSKPFNLPDRPFDRISAPAVLGATHENFRMKHVSSLSGADHERLSAFLSMYPDGKIYENVTPSYLREWAIPGNASYSMIVPIFNVDHHPFALLCAYITDPGKHLLEGYELQFLRAIGVIILSAVLKRRMILADKAKSLFISNISHELRTPLHGILAAAELIADTKLTGTQSAFLKTIQSCGASLGETGAKPELVNHVLDFTKLSGNREHTIPRSKTNLLSLVEDTVEGCWIGARARAVSEIGSVYSPPRGLPGTSIVPRPAGKRHVETVVDIAYRERGWSCVCEKAGIRRILMNLIGNSLKFTTDGYVYVGLRELAYNPTTKMITVELSVNDTGKGISKDFLTNQLFQPFSQENPLHTGTGLGLAIVNSIVRSEAVDGQVDVWSQEGVGTEIKISFDVEETQSGNADASLTKGKFGSVTVCLLGFSEHRGQQELYSIVLNMLVNWWSVKVTETIADASILIVNEDAQFLSELIDRQEYSKPVILYSSGRGDQKIMTVVKTFERSGGCCRLIFKPGGPSRLYSAMQDSVQFRAGSMHLVPGVHDLPGSPGSPSLVDSKNTPYRHTSPSLPSFGYPSSRPEYKQSYEASQYPINPAPQCDDNLKLERSISDFTTVPLADEGSVMLESVTGSLNAIKKPRVLVVEDNPVNRNLLSHWLKNEWVIEHACHIPSDEAVDGVEGVLAYRNAPAGHYSVLLVDLSMPNLGGIGCVTQIRALERTRQAGAPCAKIFALTGLATPEDKRKALAAGFDGYLIKPVSFKTLDGLFQKLASA